jgi:hypothetical protein
MVQQGIKEGAIKKGAEGLHETSAASILGVVDLKLAELLVLELSTLSLNALVGAFLALLI